MRTSRTSAVLALSLLALAPLPTLAQQTAPAPADTEKLILEKITLAHQKAQELMQLLSPRPPDQRIIPLNGEGKNAAGPAAKDDLVRPDDSLLPTGIQGLLIFNLDNSLIVRGTPAAVEALKRGIRVADVEVVRPTKDRVIVLLTPQRVKPQELRDRVLKLPGAGTATARGEEVAVDGSAAWINQAIRVAMRAEISEP